MRPPRGWAALPLQVSAKPLQGRPATVARVHERGGAVQSAHDIRSRRHPLATGARMMRATVVAHRVGRPHTLAVTPAGRLVKDQGRMLPSTLALTSGTVSSGAL
jgi:hypothetical protein